MRDLLKNIKLIFSN